MRQLLVLILMKFLKVSLKMLPGLFLVSSFSNISAQSKSTSYHPDVMRSAFANPPASARPWVYWFWSNSNVTMKGITADLEAMHRVGIGGVLIMDVNQGTPGSSIKFMDDDWKKFFAFAVKEAKRLGMKVNMNNDAGWTGSGGPWVKPEFAMQNIVSTETRVNGGQEINVHLPQPPSNGDYFRDIAVVAVRNTDDTTLSNMMDAHPLLNLVNGNITFPSATSPLQLLIGTDKNLPSITIQFGVPYMACAFDLTIPKLGGRVIANLQVSNDGKEFKTLKENYTLKEGKNSITFNEEAAAYFRLKIVEVNLYFPTDTVRLTNVEMSNRYQLDNLEMKLLNTYYKHGVKFNAIYLEDIKSAAITEKAPAHLIIPADNVIDITKNMDEKGNCKWNPPGGKWTIFRYGHTWNGAINSPAALGGEGPECDKLSKAGIRNQSEGMLKQLTKLVGPDAGKTLTTFHVDSWEINGQNWTAGMQNEFRKRRGYDITKFLPVFNGKIIGDLQQSERFMYDVRKTISELMVENYVAEMQKICHENGVKFSFECYTTIANSADAANYIDEPIAEVWKSPGFYFTMKAMASATHMNNKNITSAEMFTSGWDEKWLSFPGNIKTLGDSAFCGGINRFIFHRYAMQPWLNQKPGVAMGPWGLHYERTNTWWEYTSPWHTYLSRCQYMLRQGKLVADVLNLQPEEPGYWFKDLKVSGHDYIACSPDAFQKVKFRNGKVVDEAGYAYKIIALTHTGTMSESLLKHLRDLVFDGAKVWGEPPLQTPGLTDYPVADQRLKAIVEELWGSDSTAKDRKVGNGRVFRGIPIEEALKKIDIFRDFVSDNKLNYIHRKNVDTDIYFVANPDDSAVVANCTFRANGKCPKWWNAETGQVKNITIYSTDKHGLTHIPIALSGAGSVFIVFSNNKRGDGTRIVKVVHNGETLIEDGIMIRKDFTKAGFLNLSDTLNLFPGSYVLDDEEGNKILLHVPEPTIPMEVEVSWNLQFPVGHGIPKDNKIAKLESWTSMENKEMNYFSGTANYFKTISIPSGMINKKSGLFLNLGAVSVMAKVFVNEKEAGILWRPPYRVDISSLVHTGKNRLRIEVVNQWANRQIGDELLPEDTERTNFSRYGVLPYPNGVLKTWPSWVLADKKSPTGRQTFTTWRLWSKGESLQPSGLLGPVTLESVNWIKF